MTEERQRRRAISSPLRSWTRKSRVASNCAAVFQPAHASAWLAGWPLFASCERPPKPITYVSILNPISGSRETRGRHYIFQVN